MSAEHNHPRRCCCHPQGQVKLSTDRCRACPKHGVCICDLARSEPLDHKAGSHHEAFCPRFRAAATPYTERETTK